MPSSGTTLHSRALTKRASTPARTFELAEQARSSLSEAVTCSATVTSVPFVAKTRCGPAVPTLHHGVKVASSASAGTSAASAAAGDGRRRASDDEPKEEEEEEEEEGGGKEKEGNDGDDEGDVEEDAAMAAAKGLATTTGGGEPMAAAAILAVGGGALQPGPSAAVPSLEEKVGEGLSAAHCTTTTRFSL